MTLHFSHIAMGTRFEMWLCGDDKSHLQSVALLAWSEIDRLELMLSRHDARAEIARINQEAVHRPTRIELELFNILQDCQQWARRTNGYFDIAFASKKISSEESPSYILDANKRTIQFCHKEVVLDLGGYGKGFALDHTGKILRNYGITSACLHGGSSSVLALDTHETGDPWQVDIPHYKDQSNILHTQPLLNQGFSYSATVSEQMLKSDIIDPHQNILISEPAACWVKSPSALEAEVWSTALLAMGRAEADKSFAAKPAGLTETGWV